MKKEHFMVKGMDTEFVEFRHLEHDILFTRFERLSLTGANVREEAKYLYLIYIFRKQHKLAKNRDSDGEIDTFNIICFNKSYHTFDEMVHNLYSILTEYILNQDEVFRCLNEVQKLNPKNC
ncbi:hypothetical protein [Oceanobacillus salinisoli]|uniref:hypothetical protein n=1 Tax=Oceanobacillus salinisoli TaxID=2678611 RepID=UPI0012E0E6BF|nr:hypothetical protein [Oceanobacillus salinisoli]